MSERAVRSNKDLLIQRYANIAEGIALLFSSYVEVILHDLESQTVVYIANNISKRKLGCPSKLEEIEFDLNEKVIGPYEKINWDGNKVRSTSIILRDDLADPIGLLCINFKTSDFHYAREIIDRLLAGVNTIPQPEKLFKNDWQEKINVFINNWVAQNNTSIHTLSRVDKRNIVEELYVNGAFKEKNSQDYISNVLNMGRTTIFKYLKECKTSSKSK